MPVAVAVVGGTPTWRRGMGAALSDQGFTVADLASIADWTPGRGGSAIVVWTADAVALQAIEAFLESYPLIPVVAVIPNLEAGSLASVVRAGASGAVDEGDAVESFGEAITAAIAGRLLIPRHLGLAMARRVPATPDPNSWVSDEETEWLRSLASGATVASLAESIGYSERETFRMLGDLYEKIGVRNRTESIIWATRHGLLDTGSA